nr:hypothetical protein [Tanacetum cinerariifolium]
MGCLPQSALFLVTESHSLTRSPHSFVYGESLEILDYQLCYPTYEPPNVSPYPYPYVPYPYPYMHYPDMGNQYHGGGNHGAPGDYIFTGARPGYGGSSIVLSSGYEIGGSSRGVQDDEDE